MYILKWSLKIKFFIIEEKRLQLPNNLRLLERENQFLQSILWLFSAYVKNSLTKYCTSLSSN